ncbi:hypothetical protein [Fulvivirga sediminis]|uniref:Uncharacterized protein n=1 Tax=Fulvivirga sediminis TaxID=2803949 RepID=A0A937F6Y4_9BACT|nr:hypothetical protein [Fulvivirga sediminis]MBL3655113.1 hypothetical protein [Fulvivirga sediminis]
MTFIAFTGLSQVLNTDWSSTATVVDSCNIIYNAKFLNDKQDSLVQAGYLVNDFQYPEELDEEEYVERVKQVFFKSSLSNEHALNQGISKDVTSLSDYSLPIHTIDNMDFLYGYSLDNSMIDQVKQRVFTEGERHLSSKIKEKDKEEVKALDVMSRSRLWDKLYFDGNIGASNFLNNDIVYLSPAVGYQLWNSVSVGLGPDIQWNVTNDPKQPNTDVGLRTFVKATWLKYKIYAQAEDIIYKQEANEVKKGSDHHFYFGGGYLLPLSSKTAINISVLYNVNEEQGKQYFIHYSPWIFRIGISAFK